MPYFESLGAGAGIVFSWPGILIPVMGTLLAMITSFLPGVGNTSMAVLLLVLTIGWENESVLLLFGAITGGATFMGSITAILFNIPGSVSSTPTLLDGFPLGQRGYPKTAIACAATASAVGSLVGVLILLILLPIVRPFLLEFGPLERLLVGIWGLLTIVSMPTSSPLKAAFMAMLGLLVAMVGVAPDTGLPRWSFGSLSMTQGFGLIPVLLGVFTITELITWMRTVDLHKAIPDQTADDDSIGNGVRAVFRFPGLTARSSILGTVVGMIPGVGGTVAGFVAYGQAVQSAKGDTSQFGQGDIRGLVAPEAAVDAKDGGSLLPALAFGLPGSEAGVLLLAVFAAHGIVPGIPMFNTQLSLTFVLILSLLLSNILTSLLGIAMTPWLARLRRLRIDRLALPCLIVSLLAVAQLDSQLFDVYTAIGFGIIGYFWRTHDWPRVPFVIAFVLGTLVETNLILTVQLVELGRIVPYERVASIILAVMIGFSIVWLRTRKSQVKMTLDKYYADVALGLVFLVGIGLLAIIAWLGGLSYSLYARGIVVITLGLVVAVIVVNWVAVPAHEDSLNNHLANCIATLRPKQEHRLPLGLLLVLMSGIWAFGLSIAIGLVSLIWFWSRAERHPWSRAKALLYTVLVTTGVELFSTRVANLILSDGFVWTLISQ